MPLFSKKKAAAASAAKERPKRYEGRLLGDETADALVDYEARRMQFLRCSGMHTESVTTLVHRICSGENFGPGIALVAPALYKGISEHLDTTIDSMGDIAVYASLYMGLTVTAGMSGFYPQARPVNLSSYYNGVCASLLPRARSPTLIYQCLLSLSNALTHYRRARARARVPLLRPHADASMFTHSTVVFFTVLYRLGAVGHLRDSDKLLYLWRSRYAPLVVFILFAWGVASSIFTLLLAVNDSVVEGGVCFTEWGDATMHWFDWWHEWTGYTGKPVGAGIVHPEGEDVLNPWILKANELGLTAPDSASSDFPTRNSELYDKYSEFMQDHFGFSAACDPQRTRFVRDGNWGDGSYNSAFWIPYFIVGFGFPLFWFTQFILPVRNIHAYLTLQPKPRWMLFLLNAGFADIKINDPFDMTEAFEEFRFRAEIGALLAKKDHSGDGFVDFKEHSKSMSHLDVKVEDIRRKSMSHLDVNVEEITDLGAFLEALGMSKKYSSLAAEFELDDLQSLAKKDAAACLIELKDAGVLSGGHRIKIVNALVDGVLESVAADTETAANAFAGVRVRVETEDSQKLGCFP